MNYYALFYHVIDDYVARRGMFREAHLKLARAAEQRGELILGGALAEPTDMALLVFRGPDEKTASDFARADPYVLHGLVARWEVRPWKVVVGTVFAAVGGLTP